MSRLEIINEKWLIDRASVKCNYAAYKISEISFLSTLQMTSTFPKYYFINFACAGYPSVLQLRYEEKEFEEYENDLKFMENLLFNQ